MSGRKKVAEKKKTSNFYGRISVDLPPELYDLLKKTTKRRGQTIKGYIVNLIATDFDYDLYGDDD